MLDDTLAEDPPKAEDLGFSFDKYLQKLEQIPKHRTNDDLKLYSL